MIKTLTRSIDAIEKDIRMRIQDEIYAEADRLAKKWASEYVAKVMATFGNSRIYLQEAMDRDSIELVIRIEVKESIEKT